MTATAPNDRPVSAIGPGHDIDALGPSDSSDSGSDVQGRSPQGQDSDDGSPLGAPVAHGSDTDASGTGERAAAGLDEPVDGADILPDHVDGGSDLDAAAVERLRDAATAAGLDDTADESGEGDAEA